MGLHRMAGVNMDALMAEAELWARSAAELSAASLTTMRRLSKAQARRFRAEAQPTRSPIEHKDLVACL